MKKYRFFYLIIVLYVFSGISLISCQKGDNFSTDPNLRLTFSTDTLRFDTVFSTIGSATRQLKVYNRSNNSLTISSIELMGAHKTGFRMNVDGQAVNMATNVDLLRNDSMYIFVEVTIDPLNSNNPLLIDDSIRFNVNGNVQYVHLEAVGQDAFIWKGRTIESDTTLTGTKPFLIYDSLCVKKGVTLNLEKNTHLYFHKDASLLLYGNLNATGTLQEPIVLRGDRFDNILSDVSYNNIPGQWGGVYVDAASYNNHFEYVTIKNAVNGIIFAPSTPQYSKATLLNTIVENSSEEGVLGTNCDINGTNCLFANAGGATLKLLGGKYSFLQSTIANYMSWTARKELALVIGNTTDEGQTIPLIQCEFTNSIIAGSSLTEQKIQNTDGVISNYIFTNCLIKAKGSDDSNFVNTIWNQDPKFKNINNNGDYVYDFNLDTGSPAINTGDKAAATAIPLDLNGISRISDIAPDAGCYEYH